MKIFQKLKWFLVSALLIVAAILVLPHTGKYAKAPPAKQDSHDATASASTSTQNSAVTPQDKTATVFQTLIARIPNKQQSAYDRILAVQQLLLAKKTLSASQLDDLRRALTELVKDPLDEPHVVSATLHELTGLLLYLKETHQLSDSDIKAFSDLVTHYATMDGTNLDIRAESIRSIGDLGVPDGAQIAATLLQTGDNISIPQIARTSCLTLLKLDGKNATDIIKSVSENTTDPASFGTAAYCLGRINTPAAMSALVKTEQRFPDSGSSDASLVNMEDVILSSLQPNNPHVDDAIKATVHLWKDGQAKRYTPALLQLAAGGSTQTRSLASERLLDLASTYPLPEEKAVLSQLLGSVKQAPELSSYLPLINKRLSANIVPPISK